MSSPSNRLGGPLVLMILDGFGERPAADDNAITRARTPRYTALRETYPHTTIGTSGPDVGLPVGQMGNSEVGHLNFGAGRVAQMDISRIDCAVADGTLATNPQIHAAIAAAKRAGGRLHLLGLVSNGGVHSSLAHLLALIDQVAAAGVPLVVHAFLDGRDTPPQSAGGFLETVHARLTERRAGTIGTVTGRYWAMDRDKRWDRVEKAYRAIVFGEGRRGAGDHPGFHDAMAALADAYGLGQNDEFVEPRIVAGYDGARPGDAALFFNFRPDRARELSAALTQPAFADFDRTAGHPGAWRAPFTPFVGMTEYEASLGLPVAFTKPKYEGMFPAVIAAAGFRQLRCAETEKYAHVTYFFNGGVESPLPGEQRVLVPSPKDVATYDLRPQMSAAGVADAVVAALSAGDLDFVLVNFANPDMVGHTGVLPAAIAAIEAVDGAIGRVVDATLAQHGALLITADHGNCEQMVDPTTGGPHTAHTLNRVPFHYVREGHEHAVLRTGGRIADVAPTMLRLLGLPTPKEMTGAPLIDEG
ncbi:MAG: 2,3-bisphosphoglycerate-independent phosphoglycerate mutase [Polyangiales bacterium]